MSMEFQSDKEYHRKAIALLLCFFVAFIYVETVLKPYTQPSTPTASSGQQVANTPGAVSPSQVSGQSAGTTPATPSTQATLPGQAADLTQVRGEIPTDEQVRNAGILSVRTAKHELKLSRLGGRITELHLLEHKESRAKGAEGLNLVQHSESVPYPLGAYVGEQSDVWTNYEVSGLVGDSLVLNETEDRGEVILKGTLPDGRPITKTLTFYPDSYLIDVAVQVEGADRAVAIEWNRFLPADEASLLDPYNTQGFIWFDGQKARRESAAEFTAESLELGMVEWVSLADKYFSATLISPEAALSGKALKSGPIFQTRLQGSSSGVEVSLFAGPKSYRLLKSLGKKLELNIDFGTLAFISAPLLGLLFFLYNIFGNYGLAIVTLTIMVRLVLYPLNSASFKQMKKMQDLKPEMDRIREQFTDRQEQQMQLMAMYKKHNVNPVGGCLPMLLQMPVFIGLYSALMLAVELRHAPFALWITDLSGPEQLMIGGFSIPVMVILFVISMVVQQWITPTQMDPAQKKMMLIMPLVLGFMFASFPSGLTLYWLTSNLISIGQQKGLYWAHDGGKSALQVTLAVSAIVFVLAFGVTLV